MDGGDLFLFSRSPDDLPQHGSRRHLTLRPRWIRAPLWLTSGLAAILIGCGPGGEVRLIQPQLAGWQREIRLATEQATWSAEAGWERMLIEFPLPGASTGRATYLLYLRVPAKRIEVGFDPAASPQGRGFLIQARGRYAGLALITGGHVRVTGTSQAPRSLRTLKLNLTCEDGTQVEGEIRARRDDWYVQKFETQRRPADVQGLIAPSGPATAPENTSATP